MRSQKTTLAIALLLLSSSAAAHVVEMADREAPSIDASSFTWNPDPWLIAALLAPAALYVIGLNNLQAADTRSDLTKWRALAFFGGWLALLAALISPLDALGSMLFSAHMLQHELLMLIAAPLLVLGKPLAVFVWGLPPPWRRAIARPFRSGFWQAPWHQLTKPLSAWIIHAVVLWGWHAPLLFEASLRNDAIHELQHASFLLSALLFWWALLRGRTRLSAALYMLTTMIHTGVLGALLTFAPGIWYPAYFATTAAWGFSPLEDQQLGGLIMWVPAGFVLMLAGLLLLGKWLSEQSLRNMPVTEPEIRTTAGPSTAAHSRSFES